MSPKHTCRRYTAEFKVEVALAALTKRRPPTKLAARYALGLAHSSLYCHPKGKSTLNLTLLRLLDEEFTCYNFKGVRSLRNHLRPEQKQFFDKLKAVGGLAFVAHSFAQFQQSFERRGLYTP